MSEGYLTINQFIDDYAISRTALYGEIKKKRLILTKRGRASRIAKSDARAWAATLPTTGGSVIDAG